MPQHIEKLGGQSLRIMRGGAEKPLILSELKKEQQFDENLCDFICSNRYYINEFLVSHNQC